MKKRIFSFLLSVLMLIPLLTSVFPSRVRADDDFRCPNCGSWLGDKDFCAGCWFCEECEDICTDCGYCKACAMEDELHCPECGDSCISEEYGNVPHCVVCNKCEDCVELFETSEGLMCKECIEERGDSYIMCPNCGVNAIGTELEDLLDESDLEAVFEAIHPGDCGEHCEDCYEEFLCPECSECTLCKDVELCENCGICEECAVSYGYHCPECGDCYAEAGQCPDGGEHCVNCCEYVCEDCGTCTVGADIEFCESCNKCENCWEHCEECGECFEENGRCEDFGDHCAECCASHGWICDGCGRCTEALDLEKCEHCGLCTDCCEENRKYYGTATCILDKETKPEDLDTSKHDENHHILRYQSSSAEEHDVYCIFPGCDYYVTEPHEFSWKVKEAATETKEGLRVGFCHLCSDKEEEVIPTVDPPTYCFIEGPKNVSVSKLKDTVGISVRIGIVGEENGDLSYAGIAAFPYKEGDPLPETWVELRQNVYNFDCLYNVKKDDPEGRYTAWITYRSDAALAYGGKYVDFEAIGTTLDWKFALYDRRGGKVTYSDTFNLDWNAKHTVCTFEYVWGKLPYVKIDGKYYLPAGWYIANAGTGRFKDGTYHWLRCTECGSDYKVAYEHRYTPVSVTRTCTKTITLYVCVDCGHQYVDSRTGGSYDSHVWSDYKADKTGHTRTCQLCGYKETRDHDYEEHRTANCTGTVIRAVCKTCGNVHLEKEPGSNHIWSNDGPLNGWYGNVTHHWKVCTVCGASSKEAHTYHDGQCTVCGSSMPQMMITGSLCRHGSLHIERSDDIPDYVKEQFDAGNYGVTWIDEETGNTLGMSKTYELGPEDEGRVIRAEISFMYTEGWEWWEKDWNAYMEGHSISTKYKTVKGYEATCAAEGMKEHSVCLSCGDKFINGQKMADVSIPKLTSHTFDNDCDAFCNVCGFTRKTEHKWSDKYVFNDTEHYRECAVCKAKSDAEPHDLKTEVKKSPSCAESGLIHKSCVCGYSGDEVVPAHVHKPEHVDKLYPTCIMEGVEEHYYCDGCKTLYKDAEGKEIVGIKKLAIPIDPTNHVGGSQIGYDEKEHYTICECGEHYENCAHVFDANDRCTVCHYKRGSQVKFGIAGLTAHETVLPTCVSTGTKAYYTDKNGKIYLSKAGLVEAKSEDLILPKSEIRHVGGEKNHSDTQHWIDCACGKQLLLGDHTFGEDGKCTFCGFASSDAKSGDKSSFPWWMIVIGAILILCAAALITFFILKKRNKTNEDELPPPDPDHSGPPDGERDTENKTE